MNSFFLQGFQHPFLTAAHLITLIALGILLGIHKRKPALWAILFFVIFTLSGLVLTRLYQPDINIEIIILAIAAIMSIIIASKLTLRTIFLIIFASSIGISIGLDSQLIIIPGLKASTTYFNMMGTLVSVSLTLLFATFASIGLSRFWHSLILRILGAWVFASVLMVLALMFAPPA